MKFYIQTDIVGIDTKPLIKAAVEQGHEVVEFSHYRVDWRDDFDDGFLYSSLNTIMRVDVDPKWIGKELNFDKIYKHGYDRRCLYQEDVIFSPWSLINNFSNGHGRFIRPNSCYKTFPGQPVDCLRTAYKELTANYRVDDDTLTIIAKNCKPYLEVRCLVVGKEIKAMTSYEGEISNYGKEHLLKSCQSVLDRMDYWPYPAFIADFGQGHRQFGLIELNSVHCSALYDIPPAVFVSEIAKIWRTS